MNSIKVNRLKASLPRCGILNFKSRDVYLLIRACYPASNDGAAPLWNQQFTLSDDFDRANIDYPCVRDSR